MGKLGAQEPVQLVLMKFVQVTKSVDLDEASQKRSRMPSSLKIYNMIQLVHFFLFQFMQT